MSTHSPITRPYAKAIFALTQEADVFDRWSAFPVSAGGAVRTPLRTAIRR